MFKNITIGGKINLVAFIASFVAIVIAYFVLNKYSVQIENDVYTKVVLTLQSSESNNIENVKNVIEIVHQQIDGFRTISLTLLVVLSTMIMIANIVLSRKLIVMPFRVFEEGIRGFFQYLNKEKSDAVLLKVLSNDEFGRISTIVNESIIQTQKTIEEDEQLIKEVEDVITKVNNGFYFYNINGTTTNPSVEVLKNTINDMIQQTNEQLNVIIDVLSQYGQFKFDYEMRQRDDMNGSFGSLAASAKLIGNNVSEILALIMNSGDKLKLDTDLLSKISSDLSTASNEQAASLEETAAALEEITATIQSNTTNVAQMNEITSDLTSTAKIGLELSSKTTSSMEDISAQVTSINAAISVIDQIAFQTNILSLNAAVEAATAGEAGKGFAVVAGEVRNLATRSAQAANEIKILVEQATIKANEGKDIAEKMIEGYHSLHSKIEQTSSIVHEVYSASREQEHGITQINDAVAKLDQATQQNAASASRISDLSLEVAKLSNDFVAAASNATYTKQASKQVCDINLVTQTAKLKNDHILFKTNNFNKLGEYKRWDVVNHHNCALGKWIDEQEKLGMDFTKSNNWDELKQVHESVHSGVQKYIDQDAIKASNQILFTISSDIEKATVNVFNHLNILKVDHCQSKILKDSEQKNVGYTNSDRREEKIPVAVDKRTIADRRVDRKYIDNSTDDTWESF